MAGKRRSYRIESDSFNLLIAVQTFEKEVITYTLRFYWHVNFKQTSLDIATGHNGVIRMCLIFLSSNTF